MSGIFKTFYLIHINYCGSNVSSATITLTRHFTSGRPLRTWKIILRTPKRGKPVLRPLLGSILLTLTVPQVSGCNVTCADYQSFNLTKKQQGRNLVGVVGISTCRLGFVLIYPLLQSIQVRKLNFLSFEANILSQVRSTKLHVNK